MMEAPLRMAGKLSFATLERAKESLAQFERDTGAPLGATAEEMMEYFKRDNYTLEFHRNESLRMMVNLMGDMAKRFARMDWMFFHARLQQHLFAQHLLNDRYRYSTLPPHNNLLAFKVNDGRFQPDFAGTTIQDVRDFAIQTRQNMLRRGRAYVAKGVGARCS